MYRLAGAASGESLRLRDWIRNRANVWNLREDALRKRLNAGHTIESALALPPRVHKKWRQNDACVLRMLANGKLSLSLIVRVCGRSRDEVRRLANG
jgi:hypothetical protein